MPTPRQRLDFWRRSWDVISNKKIFLFDFWNHGTLVHGCVAAGRERGYMHIDWDGEATPCVFAQHSTGNINDIFTRGGNLNDIWDAPFFRAFREWQREYGYGSEKPSSEANWLIPCPVRDHHQIFRRLIERYDPVPEGAPAREALADKDYYRGMVSYGEELNRLSKDIWEGEYLPEPVGEIRDCAVERGLSTCASCDKYACERLSRFPAFQSEGKANLDRIRD
jgi:hypothetical protein